MSAYLAQAPRWLRSAVVLGVFLSLTATAAAQTETGRITGVVTDATGGILPGVTVNAKAVGTGATRTVVTDSAGQYVFANLPPTEYEITTELAGFNPANSKVTVSVGGAFSVPIKMDVAGTKENVNVVAEVPRINTTNGEVSTTITETQIRELPTITRNVYDLVAVAGNVSGGKVADGEEWTTTTRGTGYNINGQRASSTNILLDGSANNNEFDTTVGQNVPLDSVQEFSVVTSNFSAQYGRASGGVVNVLTKSGTNNFRGTGYEFYRSDGLSTNTFDNKANGIEKGEFTRHQLGFSIGGPIRRDKAHFFSNLEYIRVRSADTVISWVPTPQFIAASAQPTKDFFAAYGGNVTPGSTVLTRGDVSSIINATGTGAFQSLPANTASVRSRREIAAARCRRRRPAERLSVGEPRGLHAEQQLADVRPLRDAGPAGRAGHELAEPLQRLRHRVPEQEPQHPGFVHAGLWLQLHDPDEGHLEPPARRPAAQRRLPADALHEPDDARCRSRATTSRSPAICPGARAMRSRSAGRRSCCSSTRIRPGSAASTTSASADRYVHIADDRTFGAYGNAVEALNTTSAALPALDNFVLGQLAPVPDRHQS